MNGQKVKGMLGLALRARQAALGTDASRMMARAGKCGILLVDRAAGIHTRLKAEELSRKTGTPMILLPEGLIEEATGKSNMVICLQKGHFSEQILHCVREDA